MLDAGQWGHIRCCEEPGSASSHVGSRLTQLWHAQADDLYPACCCRQAIALMVLRQAEDPKFSLYGELPSPAAPSSVVAPHAGLGPLGPLGMPTAFHPGLGLHYMPHGGMPGGAGMPPYGLAAGSSMGPGGCRSRLLPGLLQHTVGTAMSGPASPGPSNALAAPCLVHTPALLFFSLCTSGPWQVRRPSPPSTSC